MSSRQQKTTFDPVVLVALGIGLITFAVILFAFQKQGDQAFDIGIGSGLWGRVTVAFVTGLTTGGLSCLAVQGGLLASSLAHQIEQDYLEQSALQKKRGNKKLQPQKRSNSALPILLFLAAKLVAYTLLGVLL